MKRISIDELKSLYPVAYDFITSHEMIELDEQRYELGNNAYVNVESYDTYSFEERRYESHVKYIDIQCILSGGENIIVEAIDKLSVDEAYDENRDVTFYYNNIRGLDNIMEEGDMLVLEPEDGHMPCISVEKTTHVKKAVFKVPVK